MCVRTVLVHTTANIVVGLFNLKFRFFFVFFFVIPQDQLAADMYSFSSKEGDYARYFVTVSILW